MAREFAIEHRNAVGAGAPTGYHSSVVEVTLGRLLLVTGQVPVDEDGNVVGVGDIDVQMRQVLRNVQGALGACGADMSNVCKFTTFLTDREHFKAWHRARNEYFSTDYPASTGVIVTGLVKAEYLVEVEAIAAIPDA